MTTEPPGDADTARAKAAAAVRVDPATAQAWALVSIADSLVQIQRDLRAMRQQQRSDSRRG